MRSVLYDIFVDGWKMQNVRWPKERQVDTYYTDII